MPEKGTTDTRECPYCKEEVKAEATLCKHCGSRLTPEKPSHGGTCPYCKESIHPEATRCKHCRSFLLPEASRPDKGCGCGGDAGRAAATALFRRLGAEPPTPTPGTTDTADISKCFNDCFMAFMMCDMLARTGYPINQDAVAMCHVNFLRCLDSCTRMLPT
jgi:hypothetical protein